MKSLNLYTSVIIFLFALYFSLGIQSCLNVNGNPTNSYKDRLEFLSKKASKELTLIPYDSLLIPRSTTINGFLKGKPSKSWTSGFYPGILWKLYHYSNDKSLKKGAALWQSSIEKEKTDSTTHDLGFKIFGSFGQGWKYTQNEKYKEIWLTAARTLIKRFNPTVGAIRSWDHHKDIWQYPVIIDNMMNLELLFEATKVTGDSTYYQIANQHAKTTLKNHFRADNSSFHVIDYDTLTGKVLHKNTHQGASHQSAWSRGQAWGLYGFTTAYRYTHDTAYLHQATKIANFIFNHPNLPKDDIPYWDFDAPNIPNEPRDVSAATITASALIELSKYDVKNSAKLIEWSDHILKSLEEKKYQSKVAPFILQHSVGSIPGKFEIDVPLIYADYYYVEALIRRVNLTKE